MNPPLPRRKIVNESEEPTSGASFPIVGVGASAGGLEAFTQLLKALPVDTGMAFVLIQHLAPSHPSALSEILSRATKMPVMEVHDEPNVEPNHVYVIPPARCMGIVHGVLQLVPREAPGYGLRRVIDHFFRALAEDSKDRAIGVVLSGTATDGTVGLEAIKAEGGITFAQDASAQHDGMPTSAIDSGCVDFVLSADAIARELVRIAQHPYVAPVNASAEVGDAPDLAQVVRVLHRSSGVDFAHYKFNTFFRRVTRRMVLNKLDTLAAYVDLLRRDAVEAEALYQDILISVTSFFRNPETWEALRNQVFPRLLKDRSARAPVRIWSVGCSTGQEAYSLAILFTECAEAAGSTVPLQLFATDLNAAAISKARAGIYPKDIAQDISPERLRRFFTEAEGGYRIAKSIRDVCVFSRHNALTDPPFSRIDLLSCRNLLIYLEPVLQQKILPMFHYAIQPSGFLWLGSSETIGSHRTLFEAHDSRHKIYAKKGGASLRPGYFPLQYDAARNLGGTAVAVQPLRAAADDLSKQADRILSTQFAPPGVLVSADLEILQYRGDTSAYLAPTSGKASLNLLKMLREGLLVGVRAAIVRAGNERAPVREPGLRIKSGGGYRDVVIQVIPLNTVQGGKQSGFLILFEDAEAAAPPASTGQPAFVAPDPIATDPARLQQELAATREYLQSVIEQQEAANEELQSANEEVQSANEELQSTNEELETSKEEIQSSNEELATVNDELNNRNTELNRLNNDLVNVLASVQMPIIMLGPDLRIRRSTPAAQKLLGLAASDVGRALTDFKLNLDGLPDLQPLLVEVIDTAHVQEHEVRDRQGRWYSLRLSPYRTLDKKIDGVILMLVDMNTSKQADIAAAHLGAIVTSSDDAIISKDLDGVITSWNKAAERLFGYSAQEAIGKPVSVLIPADRLDEEPRILERIRRGEAMEHYETVRQRKDGSLLDISLTVSPVRDKTGGIIGAAKIARDIGASKLVEQALRASDQRFRVLFDLGPVAIFSCDHDGIVQNYNRRAAQLWGREPKCGDAGERYCGSLKLFLPDGTHLPHEKSPIVQVLRTGTPVSDIEVAIERPDGSRVPVVVSFAPLKNADGDVVGAITAFYDITERKRTDDVLRQSEQHLRFVMDTAPQKLFTAKPDGEVDYFNPQWMQFTGLTFEQIKGWGWTVFIHPDDLEETVQSWKQAINTGEPFHQEHRFRRADGQYYWHSSRAMPRRDAAGNIVMWVGSNSDIQTERQTAQQLMQYAAELSAAGHQKDEFLAMLGHELRNPLAPISNAMRVLELAGGDAHAAGSAMVMLDRQVSLMSRLVEDLLDAGRITRGKIELRRAHVELRSVLTLAVEDFRAAHSGLNRELVVTLPARPMHVDADTSRLIQVVTNLLGNAYKFTDSGGHIALSLEKAGKQAIIRVHDDGIGIAADQLPRIFNLFVQIDTSMERSAGGLGIGLSLAKNLVEMHGGKLEVQSAGLGQGCEFVVWLPTIAAATELPQSPSATHPSAPVTARRILIVDDNHDSADSMAMLLKLTGHQTRTASDGLAAVTLTAAFRPEVVLMDIGLPKLNGYDAARQIRGEPWGKNILLVAVTGWGQAEDRRKSKDAGFDVHLVKPVDYAALMKLFAALPAI